MVYSAIGEVELPRSEPDTDFIKSPFIELGEEDGFVVEMQYVGLGMKNAVGKAFLRQEAALALKRAATFLPKGYRFKILDAWRPFALQKELFYAYREKIIVDFNLSNKSRDEQDAFVKRFVSLPERDVVHPPVHTTGGAVDLTIVDENGVSLPMGTCFDEFSDRTQTNYFEALLKNEISCEISDSGLIDELLNKNKVFCSLSEKEKQLQIAFNRRLLYATMLRAGFTNLPSEWWHYDYYDRFYAYYTQTKSRYNGVFEPNDLQF